MWDPQAGRQPAEEPLGTHLATSRLGGSVQVHDHVPSGAGGAPGGRGTRLSRDALLGSVLPRLPKDFSGPTWEQGTSSSIMAHQQASPWPTSRAP